MILLVVSKCGIGVGIVEGTFVGGDDSYHMQMIEHSITLSNTPDDRMMTKGFIY
jgi:hypothetical protein